MCSVDPQRGVKKDKQSGAARVEFAGVCSWLGDPVLHTHSALKLPISASPRQAEPPGPNPPRAPPPPLRVQCMASREERVAQLQCLPMGEHQLYPDDARVWIIQQRLGGEEQKLALHALANRHADLPLLGNAWWQPHCGEKPTKQVERFTRRGQLQ